MSADSTDSERTASLGRSRSRSRSLLRQVRATLTGSRNSSRQRQDSRTSRPRLTSTTTPVAFSHRLSLLSQMKSHLIGQRKYRQTVPSNSNDEEENLIPRRKFRPVNEKQRKKFSDD